MKTSTPQNEWQPQEPALRTSPAYYPRILLPALLIFILHAPVGRATLLRVSPTNQVALQMDAVDAVYDPVNELFYIAFTAYDGDDSSHSLWLATATTNALMNCEKIGSASSGPQISLALTTDGRPAVAWYAPYGRLMYAEKRTDTVWSNEVVTTSYRANCSLAFDPLTGLPWIACNSYGGDYNLYVFGKSATGIWSTRIQSWGDACGQCLIFHPITHQPSLSVQTLGWTGNPSDVYYVSNSWSWAHVDGTPDDVGYGNDLAYDPEAIPHVMYFNWTKQQLRHAWQSDASAWTNEVVATGVFGEAISLAISKSNQYYGSFVTRPYLPYNLWYVNGTNGSWISTNLCSASDLSPWSSTVLGPAERPFIVFAAREGVWLAEPQSLSLPPPEGRKPIFTSQPSGGSWNAGATISLAAGVSGTSLTYSWWKGGARLINGGQISGAASYNLQLSNVRGSNAGDYWLVVSNAFGVVTSAVAVVSVIEPTISVQPATQPVAWGQGATLSVTAVGTEPLFYRWYHEGTALAGEQASTLEVADAQSEDLGAYYVVVSNQYGVVTSAVANLLLNLAVPDTFNPTASQPLCFALQPDGKILVGGAFTTLDGQPRQYIGRLNMDGAVDTNFNPGANSTVYSLAVEGDGKILVGGNFTTLGGLACNRIGRLYPDGRVDVGFNPGANDRVYLIVVQPDGKILVGGNFTVLDGQTRNYIGRLNQDGTLDSSFNGGANSSVVAMALQADGKILLGGRFTTLCGQGRSQIGRLNSDGTLDSSFNPGANSTVYSVAVQADGKILAGGFFTSLGGQPRDHIGRLNSDGTLDANFDPGANDRVTSFAVQADGKILVSGDWITTLGGQPRNYIGRLNEDGTLDETFNPWANDAILSLALQSDGKILVGGRFSILGGQPRNGIGRLNPTEPATQSLSCDGSAITWLRNGSSPAFGWTTFDASVAGTGWSRLGSGTNVAGVWQMTGLSLPTNASVLARGYVSGGCFNGSGWFVEEVVGRPVISDLEVQSNRFGFNVRGETGETVVVEGTTTLSNPNWLPLSTNLLSSGPVYFNDPDWTKYSQRFYRLSVTP